MFRSPLALWLARLATAALVTVALAACPRSAEPISTDTRTFTCPMHCKQPGHDEPYTQRGPGQCPVCGMNLVPVTAPAPTPGPSAPPAPATSGPAPH